MAILTDIGVGLAASAIGDSIKAVYTQLCASKNERPNEIEFQHVQQADGTEITIVRLKE